MRYSTSVLIKLLYLYAKNRPIHKLTTLQSHVVSVSLIVDQLFLEISLIWLPSPQLVLPRQDTNYKRLLFHRSTLLYYHHHEGVHTFLLKHHWLK